MSTASPTIIDLTKPGDLALVHRAVVNGWDVPDETREQICDQLDGAIQAYAPALADMPAGDKVAFDLARRRFNQFIKLGRLMLAMEARNMIDCGHLKSHFPYLRKRNPEQRRRRARRTVDVSAADAPFVESFREAARRNKPTPVKSA
jgi:hypothetical protein